MENKRANELLNDVLAGKCTIVHLTGYGSLRMWADYPGMPYQRINHSYSLLVAAGLIQYQVYYTGKWPNKLRREAYLPTTEAFYGKRLPETP